jgi:ribosomal protein S18 acetylase RimI-like enzyme
MPVATALTIRPAEPADHDALQALWDDCGLGRATPDEWDALMSGNTAVILVAVDRSRIVGTSVASFDGWRAYIYHVAVASGWRRQGIAHQLIEAAEQYLLSGGARYVFVTVDQERPEALALVASEGYLPEGEIVLAKRLATRMT